MSSINNENFSHNLLHFYRNYWWNCSFVDCFGFPNSGELSIIPFVGYAVDFAKKPLGFALIIIIPATLIIYDEIRKIYGELKKSAKKENAS